MSEDDGLKAMGHGIKIDEARIGDHHRQDGPRGTVEETLNALLDRQADRLCGAGRHETTRRWQDIPAGIRISNLDRIIRKRRRLSEGRLSAASTWRQRDYGTSPERHSRLHEYAASLSAARI